MSSRPHSGRPSLAAVFMIALLTAVVVAIGYAATKHVNQDPPPALDLGTASGRTDSGSTSRDEPLIVVLGDSYTQGTPFGGRGSHGWPAVLQTRYTVTVRSLAKGGTGYAPDEVYKPSFREALPRALRSKPDVVLFVGSRNDSAADPVITRSEAVKSFEYVKKKLPDAKIIAIGTFYDSSKVLLSTVRASDQVESAAKEVGVPFYVGYDWFQGRPELIGGDDTHPTNDGHTYIANRIAGILKDEGVAIKRRAR